MDNKSAVIQIQDPQETPPSKPQKTSAFVSRGWRIHNELTYRAIDWLVNSTIGVGFAYWTGKTESGKRIFTDRVTNGIKKGMGILSKNPTFLNESAKWGSELLSIMMGGFAIIIPMMVMENKNNKKHMVKWFDEKIYGREEVANNPKFAEAYRKIDEEPKKGFWAGMAARGLALAPIFVVVLTPKLNKYATKYMYDPLGNASKWLAGKLHINPTQKMLGNIDHVHPGGNTDLAKVPQNAWEFLHQRIGFDISLTFFYALMHEIAYKSFAAVGIKTVKHPYPSNIQAATHSAPPAQDNSLTLTDSQVDMQKTITMKRPITKAASHTDLVASSRMETAQAAAI